ncbi:MAG: hypothetical protein ABF968_09845 [Acetobacter sp.]|uniref:hypothetical protein n=1 Tax=Acetobacter sp. TaxID=440 RepID=UPI0039E98824
MSAFHRPLIPSIAHFIFQESTIVWQHAFAVASAAQAGMEQVIVHHVGALPAGPQTDFLRSLERAVFRRLDKTSLLRDVEEKTGIRGLSQLYTLSSDQETRNCILSAALIHAHGGIFLTPETLMIAPLLHERTGSVFFGSRRVSVAERSLALSHAFRAGLMKRLQNTSSEKRRSPSAFAPVYPLFGAIAGAPFLTQWLHALAANHSRQAETLLRELLEKNTDPSVIVYPPDTMCSLSMRSARRLFRRTTPARLSTLVPAGARMIHWKVSPATQSHQTEISPDHVMNHAYCQPYSALVWKHAPAVKKIVYL